MITHVIGICELLNLSIAYDACRHYYQLGAGVANTLHYLIIFATSQ
jgi:hypothetical protein